ncbi:hypothetical protein Glove_562g36 [Diversispora epigaea]|uniref:Uncharacterized protein n=1 Tax=Diversispora epigaea TaxID=1348612 RepID=A0A397GAQ4_9GLOM|nr:hypothetical protein Glove_562g36 [Diversispora epigaea]
MEQGKLNKYQKANKNLFAIIKRNNSDVTWAFSVPCHLRFFAESQTSVRAQINEYDDKDDDEDDENGDEDDDKDNDEDKKTGERKKLEKKLIDGFKLRFKVINLIDKWRLPSGRFVEDALYDWVVTQRSETLLRGYGSV